jgi:hypothetical protein
VRAVEHLGFMLSGNPQAKVRFFHVVPRLKDYCEIDFNQRSAEGFETLIA